MNVGELFVTLGFNADTVKLKDFAKMIGDLPLDVAAGIAALAGIEFELQKIAEDAMNTAASFEMFTSQTGLSWKELQRWQIAAQQVNVSADDVAQSINALQRNMAEIRLGRGNIAPFQLLGIGVQQDAFGILSQLRERIRGLDRATATNLISQMGLTPSMIQVLSLTNEEFAKLSTTIRGMTSEQEGSFLHAKQQLVQFGLAAKYIGFEIVDHLITAFSLLIEKLKQFKTVMIGIGVVLAAAGLYFAPITAAIIGLILVLDDLAVYFQGGHSMIGLAIEGIKKLADALKDEALMKGLSGIGKIATVASFIANPIGGASNLVSGAVSRVVNQTNNIHVHSSAPAHDVGKAVKQEIDKGVAQASYQTNNQGY